MVILAPAKINLFLEVLEKRADGFHEIATVFQEISLADEITLETSSRTGIHITSDHKDLPTDETNLAHRAASLVMERLLPAGFQKGVKIHITKRIPVAAGLGGGSSNAAAVLKGLLELWGLEVPRARLRGWALEIGSDVPFFLYGGRCWGRSRGERIELLSNRPSLSLVLVNPGIEVSTGAIYRGWDRMRSRGDIPLTSIEDLNTIYQSFLVGAGLDSLLPLCRNRLEDVAIQEYPVIRRIQQQLVEAGCVKAAMSGSGPTVYGILKDPAAGPRIAEQMRAAGFTAWAVETASGSGSPG